MTRFEMLYAQQTDDQVRLKMLLSDWILPAILFISSWLLRKSAPKLIILMLSAGGMVFLDQQAYAELLNDVPFAGMGDMVMEIIVLVALTIPLLFIAHGVDILVNSLREKAAVAPSPHI